MLALPLFGRPYNVFPEGVGEDKVTDINAGSGNEGKDIQEEVPNT